MKRKRIEAGVKAKAALVAVREDCTASQLASKFGVHAEQYHRFQLRLGDCQYFSDILGLDHSRAATGLFEPQRFLGCAKIAMSRKVDSEPHQRPKVKKYR